MFCLFAERLYTKSHREKREDADTRSSDARGISLLPCVVAAIAFLGPVVGSPRHVHGQTKQASRPNILFIAVDDLNDWIGVLGGHPQTKTPNIDRLAERGTIFRNAHCAAPACNPSRAALMTGIRPSTSGVYLNPQPWRKSPILANAKTIPQHFRDHGYTAVGSGKIYHGKYPDPASWNEWAPSPKTQSFNTASPKNRNQSGLGRSHFDWGKVDVEDKKMGDVQTVDYVLTQLEREWDTPFFLACGIYRPHLPWYVPPKYFDPFPLSEIQLPTVQDNDLSDVPAAGQKMAKPSGDHAAVLKKNQWKQAVQGYLASIHFADTQIGRVLDGLDKSPYGDNTIVVFWTDHGWHLGEKQHWRKFSLWERATRTPVIIVAPGVNKPGSVCDRPTSLLDLYPTLCDLADLPHLAVFEGQSLLPLLRDPNVESDRVAITTHGKGNHGVRSQDYRYIRYANGTHELYNHRNDPNEWTNLVDLPEFQVVVRELSERLPAVNVASIPHDK
jgi:arylsulfatase A-like enzyme